MKTTLTVSVGLNALLLGVTVLFWRHPRVIAVPGPATPATATDVQVSPAPVVQMVAAPFRWRQLLSDSNYLGFVANLRAAGCPEATVEDIVRGDTARVYAMMRERSGVSAMESGRWSGQAETQMAAYFLGQTPDAQGSTVAAKQNYQAMDVAQTGNATLAAFLQSVDLTTPEMTPEQAQETANLGQTLLAQVNAGGQVQNSQAKTPSASDPGNTGSSQTGDNNSQPGPDNSQSGTDSPQPDTDNSQTALNEREAARQRLLQFEAAQPSVQQAEQESILGGLFGMGAAMQYDQYQAQEGQQ